MSNSTQPKRDPYEIDFFKKKKKNTPLSEALPGPMCFCPKLQGPGVDIS